METSEIKMHINHSESLSGIATALAKVQSELKPLGKGEDGYGYKYLDLAGIMEYILPITSKCGIAVTQFGVGVNSIATMLIHTETGEFIKGVVEMPKADVLEMKGVNIAQKNGSLRTYFRRYSVSELLGITAVDEDNDVSSKGFEKAKTASSFKKEAKVPAKKEAKKADTASKPNFRRKKKETAASAGGL